MGISVIYTRFCILLITLFCAFCVSAASPVVVIHGKASIANKGEHGYAAALARHAVKWYRDGGIAADISDDTDIAKSLSGRKVALLVYCASPDAKQLKELRGFVSKGGRLIVTYSSSQELADILGVRLGSYRKTIGFAEMVFANDRPVNVARSISQSSQNIFSAYPIKGKSTLLAWWTDQSGQSQGEAAWLKSKNGYWMTHVLLADGGASDKADLLVALTCDLAPSLWTTAARSRLSSVGRVGPWQGVGDAQSKLAKMKVDGRVNRAANEVATAADYLVKANKKIAGGDAAAAWALAKEVDLRLYRAYGFLQSPSNGEIHGVWDHSGQGLYPGNWERTCKELSARGITDLFVNVAAPGFAHYASQILPRSPLYEAKGDQLSLCIKAAHRHGIRVHAWLICFSTTGATTNRMDIFRKSGWLLGTTAGSTQKWLDPSSVDVRAHLVSAAKELMTNYRIDGLHLDFVRYQDYYNSLGYTTRVRFERDARKGKPVANWESASKSGATFKEVVRWRAKQVSTLVAEIKATQRICAPKVLLSAAVLGKYPTCVESVGQDWMSWLSCGYLDYALPMNYTESPAVYSSLLATQLNQKRIAPRIIGGIGVTAAESRLGPDKVIDQVKALREGGAAGFVLFDLDATLSKEILPILSLGITERVTP